MLPCTASPSHRYASTDLARPTTAKDSTPVPRNQKPYAASNAAWPASSSTTSTPTTKTKPRLANPWQLDIGETHGSGCSCLQRCLRLGPRGGTRRVRRRERDGPGDQRTSDLERDHGRL